jgi:hypothetical protein
MFETILLSIVNLTGLIGIPIFFLQTISAASAACRARAIIVLARSIIIVVIASSATYVCIYKMFPVALILVLSGTALALDFWLSIWLQKKYIPDSLCPPT